MNTNLNKANTQRGIGLLELMLSLAIIAVLLVMATRYFIVTSRSQQVNQASTQIGALQGAISNWKGANPTYTGLTPAALNSIGALTTADYDGTNINSPWSTPVTIDLKNNDTSYTLTYTNIPGWACISLVQKYGGANNVSCSTSDPKSRGNFIISNP